MSLNLPELTADVNAHQNLPDQPTLSANELKQAWDQPSSDIKTYINNTLIPQIESQVTSEITNGVNTAKAYTDSAVGGIDLDADNIDYDNTSSGMTADDVQDAIDELKTGLTSVSSSAGSKTDYSDFEITSHSSGTLSNGNSGYATKTISITKSGYYPIGIVGFTSTSKNNTNNQSEGACLMELYLSERASGSGKIFGKTCIMDNIANTYSSSFTAYVLWVKVR